MKKITWTILFALAMGMFEAVVVIYLRLLYYPQGFNFPLLPLPEKVGLLEICREAATVVMLVGVGILTGTGRLERFAYFILAFAVWDLFYYVSLYVFIDWPLSISTWDVLFLIPLPWIGPVWAPCMVALLMMAGSVYIIHSINTKGEFILNGWHWMTMLGGVLACIISFMTDFIAQAGSLNSLLSLLEASAALTILQSYVPQHFNSILFFTGFFLMTVSLVHSIHLNQKQK